MAAQDALLEAALAPMDDAAARPSKFGLQRDAEEADRRCRVSTQYGVLGVLLLSCACLMALEGTTIYLFVITTLGWWPSLPLAGIIVLTFVCMAAAYPFTWYYAVRLFTDKI